MDKKTYIKPEMLVMNIEAETLLAASPDSVEAEKGSTFVESGTWADSKGHTGVWDFDEED